MDRSVLLVLFSLLGFAACQDMFNYTDDCIMVSLMVEADVTYKMKNGSTGMAAVMGKNFSDDVMAACDEESTYLDFTWMGDLYSIQLEFTATANKSWNLHSVMFQYYTDDNPDFKDPTVIEEYFETNETGISKIEWGNSYRCVDGVTFNLENENKVKLTLKNLQMQVFSFDKPNEFGKVTDCAHKPTPTLTPTATPTPTPSPPHKNNTYVFDKTVYNNNSLPCIRVMMELNHTIIKYLSSKGTRNISLPLVKAKDFHVMDHHCGTTGKSRNSNITIGWPTPSSCYSLAILFSADFTKGDQGWTIDQLQFHYNTSCNPYFVDAKESNATLSYNKDFTDDPISLTRSFKCDVMTDYFFASKQSNSTATLTMTELRLQAFSFSGNSNSRNDSFGSGVSCSGNKTPVIVPIVVGIALGVFVSAVVVAYVIGRIRQHKKKSGYERL